MLSTALHSLHVVLIGSDGQLGTDLRRVLPPTAVGLDFPAFDVRDADQVRTVLERERPDWVINCAARTDVDGCENAPQEAFAVNAVGALHVARAAARVKARVAYISTDYVFGAQTDRSEPYGEGDVPAPVNVYGTSKLAGEHMTLRYAPHSLVVRTSGLYGHAGARGKGGNFVETMLRLAATGETVRVVNDQRLSPTSTVALADRLVGLVARGAEGIVHVAARDNCTWYEFAREIFLLAGFRTPVSPVTSTQYPRAARRPFLSALRSERLSSWEIAPCPSWREMLETYLRTRTQVARAGAEAAITPPEI